MDEIQKILVEQGRKDLAQKYYQKIAKKDDKMKSDVVGFLSKNPNPKDVDLHAWTEQKGYNIHDVETQIYTLATKFVKFLIGGRANAKGLIEKDVDPAELKKGIEIEAEHIDDIDVQKRISLDHLAEFSNYYLGKDGLVDMEKKLKKNG